MLPTLWFRNTWSWAADEPKPMLQQLANGAIKASHPHLGDLMLYCEGASELLFTENESNANRLWGTPNPSPYVKDAFHRYVVNDKPEAVNPARMGTKSAAHYLLEVPAKDSKVVRLRLNKGLSQTHSRSSIT